MSPGGWGQSSPALLGVEGGTSSSYLAQSLQQRWEDKPHHLEVTSTSFPFGYRLGSFHPCPLQPQLLRIWSHIVGGGRRHIFGLVPAKSTKGKS